MQSQERAIRLYIWHTWTKRNECLAHENHPNFMRSLGHRPQTWVILIMSNGLEINSQKTPCQNGSLAVLKCTAREPQGIFDRGLLHITPETI